MKAMNRESRPPTGLVCRLSRVPGVSARVKRVSIIFFSPKSLYSVYSVLWNPNLTSTNRSLYITGERYIGVLFHKFCYN